MNPDLATMDLGDPQSVPGGSLGVIMGAVASFFVILLLMVILVVCLLVIVRRRKHRLKIHKSQFVGPLDNPMHQSK
jgi:hypothetical protein